MNICYLIRSFSTRGGTENYVYNMSMALAALGHNIHIVSSTGKGQWDFHGFEDKIFIHQIDFKEHVFKGSWRLEKVVPLYAWRYGRLVKKRLPVLIKKYAIDIIEAPDWSVDAWSYLPERTVPVCVRLHGYPGFKDDFDRGTLKKWPKNRSFWSLFREHILGADLVTGVSKSYTDFVKKVWEIKEKDVKIIPIGINLNLFCPANISRESNVVLFAGRLEESKGMEVLAQAISLISKKMPDVKFYLAGRDLKYKDNQQTWSQYLINNFGKERVIYLGLLSTQELVHYYQSVTVCVLPSLYEPGGTVAFEAMACGCPVIASKVGGFEEVIRDEQTGLLIPAGNPEDLTNAIIELLQKPQIRQKLSQEALGSIQKHFGINEIVQQTLLEYAHAIKLFKNRKN